ncbi:MAG TPA: hypothetical protein DD412_04390, partial [Holosporales bacterium]|nr:hypothetical protein [Holosporales bacterium]
DRLALTYREGNGLTEDDELPKAGPITFSGHIKADIFMGFNTGTILNHADIKSQDIFLASFFGDVIMSSVVERESHGNGNFQDKILAQARLEASNIIKIFAGQDIIFQGAETISEVSTHILALARIFDIPATLVSQRTEQLSGKYKGTETWMHIHNHVSRHASSGSIKQETVGSQELCGGQYTADFIDILADGDIEITDAVDHMSHSFTGKKSSGFKSKKRQESEQRQTSRGAGFKARKAPTNIESRKGDIGLTAPQFTGGHGATLSAPLGEVMIRLGRESFEKTSSSTMTSSTWNKMVQKSEKHLTFSVPTSDGPVKIKALKTIVEMIQGKELELLKKLEILDGELVKQAVAEFHEYDETVVESLDGPAAAVIAIAVSCITAGAAGPAMAIAMGGKILGAIATAGFASLASQAAVSLISNKGDLSKVVKEITSSQALRSLATSMVTAGLVAGAGELINGATSTAKSVGESATSVATQTVDQSVTQTSTLLETTVSTSTKAFDIGERVQEALIRASSETLVNSTIGGQDFQESIISAARSGVATVAGSFFAHEWGGKYKDVDSQIDYFTHKLVHGIIGAGMGAISDGEALAGAIGGVVGEVVGEAYVETHPEGFDTTSEDYDPTLRKSLQKKGEILTQVTSALAAAFLDQNPNVAACTALNAVTENSFSLHETQTHFQTAVEVEELQDALALETDSEKRAQIKEKISRRQNRLKIYEDKQAAYTQLGCDLLGPIENEMYLRVMNPWNERMDDIHRWTAEKRLMYSPEVLSGLNIDCTLSTIDFAADLFKLPTTKGEAALVLPVGKMVHAGGRIATKGLSQFFKKVPVFDIRQSTPVFDVLDLGGSQLKFLTGPMTTPSGRRYLPGVASFDGTLPKASSFPNWIRGSEGNAAKVPWEVANKLAGREFKTFDQFREALWLEVSKNPTLIQGFSAKNRKLMSQGKAPHAIEDQQLGLRKRYELDHMQELQHGGNVYDMHNIIIRTPLNHIKGK